MNDVLHSGADSVCAALTAAGVDTVFGVPGTQTVTLYESLRKAGIRTVTATHEMAATFMAQGYYRASGRLAAVSAIPGPGFAFTIAALAEASLDSAALVLLTGIPPVSSDGCPRSQGIDQAAIVRPVVKAVIDVEEAGQVGSAVRRACELARHGEPGPVLVQLAAAAYAGDCIGSNQYAAPIKSGIDLDTGPLQEAARFVAAANRLLIYAGQGAAGAAGDLQHLVRSLGGLMVTTPSGRGVVPEDDDRVLPFDASGDVAGLNLVASECDVILAIGAGFAENGTAGFRLKVPTDRLVRVDTSSTVLARPPAALFSVQASAEAFVAAVMAESEHATGTARAGFDADAVSTMRARLKRRTGDGPSDARIAGDDASDFFCALRRAMPADSCLVLDSGMHQLLARRHFVVTCPRGLLFPSDFQSMGFGLPAAIGAKLAQPDRPVVALIGDGGAAMTGLELITATRLGLGLPVVVFDNGALGLIRLDQLLAHGQAHATELGGLDFEALSVAVGCDYARADSSNIEAEIRSALDRKVPTLIRVPLGDAPALRRARTKVLVRKTAKSLLGPGLLAAYRRMRMGRREQ